MTLIPRSASGRAMSLKVGTVAFAVMLLSLRPDANSQCHAVAFLPSHRTPLACWRIHNSSAFVNRDG